MGFGVIIAADGVLLDADLMDCLTEVRVQQYLDTPTEFAVRFQEDLDSGKQFLMEHEQARPETVWTIAVDTDDGLVALVHGPVERVRCSVQLGGPGSWFELHGRDRRIELDRVCETRCWEGFASDVAQSILQTYKFVPELEKTSQLYSKDGTTLNQRGTDYQLVSRLAAQNNFCFWLSYEASQAGDRLKVKETAHFMPSPPRPSAGGSTPAPTDLLTARSDLALRVHVEGDECQTVTKFELEVDVERPSQFRGTTIDDLSLLEERTNTTDSQPPIERRGQGLTDAGRGQGIERVICVTSAGPMAEADPKGNAALTRAGWFIEANGSTTAYMLDGVLSPHDIVKVAGLGGKHSGNYQVEQVTHVINASDHFMDFKLRRNALGQA